MKRSAVILLAAIYLLLSTGMEIKRFYCCGRLDATTLTYGTSESAFGNVSGGVKDSPPSKCKCCKAGMHVRSKAMKSMGCRSEKRCFKIKDGHINVAIFSSTYPFSTVLNAYTSSDRGVIARAYLPTRMVYEGNAPPGSSIPIYSFLCNYRI